MRDPLELAVDDSCYKYSCNVGRVDVWPIEVATEANRLTKKTNAQGDPLLSLPRLYMAGLDTNGPRPCASHQCTAPTHPKTRGMPLAFLRPPATATPTRKTLPPGIELN